MRLIKEQANPDYDHLNRCTVNWLMWLSISLDKSLDQTQLCVCYSEYTCTFSCGGLQPAVYIIRFVVSETRQKRKNTHYKQTNRNSL